MPLPKVYIVVLNYNGWQDTIECLESLSRLTYANYEIIIVDNHSRDNSVQCIQEWAEGDRVVMREESNPLRHLSHPPVEKPLHYAVYDADEIDRERTTPDNPALTILCTNANLGFAGGNNVGLQYALEKGDADYIWLLNNDTVVTPDSLSRLVDCYTHDATQRVGLVGCKIKYYHLPEVIQCVAGSYYNKWLGYSRQIGNHETDRGQYDNIAVRPDLINGACMLVSVPFLQSVGLLNEEYFLYFEEQDWAERARRHGFTLSYSTKAVIYHKEGTTIGGGQWRGNTRFSDFYFSRSKLLFTERYFNRLTVLSVKAAFLLTIANRLRRGQFDRVSMIMKIIMNPRSSRYTESADS